MTNTNMNTGAASLSDEQIEALKAAALAATPQNIDSAQRIERYEDGSFISCPACGGEGNVELNSDFCNYDGEALGVQFYGIGNAHKLAEDYFRMVKPATALALIERLQRAEAAATPQADAAPTGAMTRTQVQGKAIEHGFQYWRAPDAHGVTGTKPQAIELLQDLLGVEVEIEDTGCQTCNGTGVIGGPSYSAPDEGGERCPDCAAIAAGGAQEADVLEWLETEVSAVSCRYHGDPSYDHDAYWMKDRVMKLIAEARKAFPLPRVAETVALTPEQREAIEWAAGRAHVEALGKPIYGAEGKRWRVLSDMFRAAESNGGQETGDA